MITFSLVNFLLTPSHREHTKQPAKTRLETTFLPALQLISIHEQFAYNFNWDYESATSLRHASNVFNLRSAVDDIQSFLCTSYVLTSPQKHVPLLTGRCLDTLLFHEDSSLDCQIFLFQTLWLLQNPCQAETVLTMHQNSLLLVLVSIADYIFARTENADPTHKKRISQMCSESVFPMVHDTLMDLYNLVVRTLPTPS